MFINGLLCSVGLTRFGLIESHVELTMRWGATSAIFRENRKYVIEGIGMLIQWLEKNFCD
jgi:hypothetical protein